MHTLSIQDQQAGALLPDITALLWNPPRLLYCRQEKVSRHSCERWTTSIPIWFVLSITVLEGMGHVLDSLYLSLCDHQLCVLRGCCFDLDKNMKATVVQWFQQ